MKRNLSILSVLFLLTISCASIKQEDVSYLTEKNKSELAEMPTLNIFSPKNKKFKNNPVLLFVHGGNWNSGDKETYNFLGRNFAKKGITTVIVGYTLSPKANYDTMAKQVATAVTWTKENISNYNGNPDEIYLTGHSAGAHLIALIGTNPKYLEDNSCIKGIILNDAAGLDMKSYLEKNPPTTKNDYISTWTDNPENWKEASPIYYLDKNSPKFMIYLGEKSYRSIKNGTQAFVEELNEFQPDVKPILVDKNHVRMITQFIYPWSDRYDEIIAFIKKQR